MELKKSFLFMATNCRTFELRIYFVSIFFMFLDLFDTQLYYELQFPQLKDYRESRLIGKFFSGSFLLDGIRKPWYRN